MTSGYVYCVCCGYDCIDGPLCLLCEEADCDPDGDEECKVTEDDDEDGTR